LIDIERPLKGIEVWDNPHGIKILRLHYSADPDKGPEWVATEKPKVTNPAFWDQEQEIDFGAMLGQKIYWAFNPEITLEKVRTIPRSWPRFTALDTHPMKPHALLWGAMDPYENLWIYRELWPSRVYSKPGNVPADDNRWTIRQYVEAWQWLESRDNPENNGRDEEIYWRVIDYAARAQGKGTSDDPEAQPHFQARFEAEARNLPDPFYLRFRDARKDHDAGFERVNSWLLPHEELTSSDKWTNKSKIRIIAKRCPELVYQLRTVRNKPQTPTQAELEDPMLKAIQRRNDLSDCLRYLVMSNPYYTDMTEALSPSSGWKPISPGIAY
jgi:hypothetical protein